MRRPFLRRLIQAIVILILVFYAFHTTLNLKTFDYPLTTSNAFDHICRQQTYGFA